MHHIRATLPDIKQRITTQLQKYNAELTSLGGPMGDQSSSGVVLQVITDFCAEFRSTIDGGSNDLSLNELSGGARISFVFHELFNQGIKTIDPFDQVKDGDIRTILYNSSVSMDISCHLHCILTQMTGIDASTIRWYHRFRGHRQATDQAVGRPKSQVLPACI